MLEACVIQSQQKLRNTALLFFLSYYTMDLLYLVGILCDGPIKAEYKYLKNWNIYIYTFPYNQIPL